MNFKAALIIAGLTAVGTAGPLSIGIASAATAHPAVVAFNDQYRDRDRDADDSKIPCPKLLDARNRLETAQDALSGILADLPRNDSAYGKIKEAQRQIIDGARTMQNRLQRNHCPL
ncbi:MAG: hypothetical protein NVSMB64_33180 [Candidatus Velthaea sp.]